MKAVIIKLLLVVIVAAFSGCAVVDRGNFPPMSPTLSSMSWKNSYDVIDTSKEDIGIPKPPHTPIVERFEVRDGGCATVDCGKQRGKVVSVDSHGDRERYELQVWPKDSDNYNGSEYWYTWDIYFPKDFKSIYPAKATFGQFHAVTAIPYMIDERHDGLYLKIPTREYEPRKVLIENGKLRGNWHTIVLHIKWNTDPNKGLFAIWVDGKLRHQETGRTYIGGKPWFKYGIYRCFLSRYKNHIKWNRALNLAPDSSKEMYDKIMNEDVVVPTQVVYYSHVRRANTREELFK